MRRVSDVMFIPVVFRIEKRKEKGVGRKKWIIEVSIRAHIPLVKN